MTTQSRNLAFLFQSTKLDLTTTSGCAGKLVGKKCWLEQIQNCQWRQHRFCTGRVWSGVFEGWWENMKPEWLFFIRPRQESLKLQSGLSFYKPILWQRITCYCYNRCTKAEDKYSWATLSRTGVTNWWAWFSVMAVVRLLSSILTQWPEVWRLCSSKVNWNREL